MAVTPTKCPACEWPAGALSSHYPDPRGGASSLLLLIISGASVWQLGAHRHKAAVATDPHPLSAPFFELR